MLELHSLKLLTKCMRDRKGFINMMEDIVKDSMENKDKYFIYYVEYDGEIKYTKNELKVDDDILAFEYYPPYKYMNDNVKDFDDFNYLIGWFKDSLLDAIKDYIEYKMYKYFNKEE